MSMEPSPDSDERIVEIEMERLRDFRNHPFKIKEDHEMKALMDSIHQYGILNPIIVRPLPEGIYDNPEIISGHASGADTLAERYAEDHGIPYIIFKPDWKRYGRGAGPIRNKAMIDYASEDNPVVIAFWNGESKGTRNMIDQGRKRGAIIHVIMCQDSATDHENLIE